MTATLEPRLPRNVPGMRRAARTAPRPAPLTPTGDDRTGYFSQHTDTDPTRRRFYLGDQAAERVVAASIGRPITNDLETAGLDENAFRVKVDIIGAGDGSEVFVLDATNPHHQQAGRDARAGATEITYHNSAFDVPPLVGAGMMAPEDVWKVRDTLIDARMAYTGALMKRSLGELERKLLKGQLRSQSKDRFADWAKVNKMTKREAFAAATYDTPVYTMYAGWDALITALAREPVRAAAYHQLTSHPFGRYGADQAQAEYLVNREQLVNRILLARSVKGLRLDHERVDSEQDRFRGEMLDLADAMAAQWHITEPSNRNQLIAALEADDGFPIDHPLTKTGKRSTAKAAMKAVTHPAARAFRAYDVARRMHGYMESARLVAQYTDGRIHSSANVMEARTGRLSMGTPPLHQFTGASRGIILPDEGDELVSMDWWSIEPVIAANLAGDRQLLDPFEHERQKIYRVVEAAGTGISYDMAKVTILALLYGEGPKKLGLDLGMSTEDARDLQNRCAAAMPRTERLVKWAAVWAGEIGKAWTLSGRIIDVDPQFGYRGSNYLVQGSAYDVLAETVVATYYAGVHHGLYLTLHDELVVSRAVAPEVARIMLRPPERLIELAGRRPTLRIDASLLGDRWGKEGPDVLSEVLAGAT
ncbi:MAG TPA: DNA polymerase [Pseudonocardia sp.]|uniref:DNA polymerase n=1 Tax=Pseudonocardia sp. TaxID=60912 RepID=UPI002CA23928|nr:DNA polymerase [Pseudonocardia sp.]HTF50803.1 DNA polymerase [Pseudonocardia sp.]